MYNLAINNRNAKQFIESIDNNRDKEVFENLSNKHLKPEETDKKEASRRKLLKEPALLADEIIGRYNKDNVLLEMLDINDEEVVFLYGDTAKKLFLRHLGEVWETDNSLRYALNAIKEYEDIEAELNKPLYLMNDDEVKFVISEKFNNASYYSMRFRVKVFSEMQKFYSKELQSRIASEGWSKYFTSDKFRDLFSVDAAITKDELINLFNITKNAQEGIVPLLIFEGLAFSRVEDADELRYIKQEDILPSAIKVNLGRENDRVIAIDGEVEKAIASVLAQKFILTNSFGRSEISLLDKSDYLLKVVNNTNKSKLGKPITYRGVYSRLGRCFDTFENNISHKAINPKTIKSSGQYHYINKFLEDGHDLQTALRMTLKRFGEWHTLDDEKMEARHMTNRQRMNRLKKKWEVYRNGENSN